MKRILKRLLYCYAGQCYGWLCRTEAELVSSPPHIQVIEVIYTEMGTVKRCRYITDTAQEAEEKKQKLEEEIRLKINNSLDRRAKRLNRHVKRLWKMWGLI